MKELKRHLGLTSVIAICISSMIGSGIFVLPGLAFSLTGPSTYLAYLFSALCVLPAAISKSELATAMPTSGGTYVYLVRTFGPLAGTIAGLGLFVSVLLKSAFALIGFGAYLSVFTNVDLHYTALGILSFIVVLNMLGVGKVSNFLIAMVITCIGGLIFLSIESSLSMDMNNFTPLFPFGKEGFFNATGLVFVSFAGVTKVAAISEEIQNPEKNLPRGILISLLVVAVIYGSINFFLAANFPYQEIAGNLKPIYTLAKKVGGNITGAVFAILGVLTMSSMANAGILAASRFPFAMGRDQLLPQFLGKLSSKYLTPIWSIFFSGVFVATAILTMDVPSIAKLASAFMLTIYIFENIAVIVLRESRVQWYKPSFSSPFYPWIQIFGILSGIAILISMDQIVFTALGAFIIPSIIIYLAYGRSRVSRKGVIGIRGRRKDLVEDSPELTWGSTSNIQPIDFSVKADVVVSLLGKERSPETLVEMAASLAGTGKLEVAHLIEVPEQTGVRDLKNEFTTVRSLRRRLMAMEENLGLLINYDPIVSHDILKTIHEISNRLDCQWLLTEWGGKTRGAFTFHNPIAWLKDHLSCSLIVFRDAGVRNFKKIMVFVHDYGTEDIVLNIADHFAQVNNAELSLVRFLHKNDFDERVETEKKILLESSQKCQSPTNFVILKGTNKIETIISITAEYDLMVYGDFKDDTVMEKLFGRKYDKLTSKAACSVMTLQKFKRN